MIDDGLFALNVLLCDLGVKVQEFQERFGLAVLVVGFGELGENFFCFGCVAEAEVCLCPEELELFVVRSLGEGFVEHRERLVEVLLCDGVFECRLETLFVRDVKFFEALLEVRFGEHSLDDVCNLSFVDDVDFGDGLHAEHLDEAHVFAIVATDNAERKVHACRK